MCSTVDWEEVTLQVSPKEEANIPDARVYWKVKGLSIHKGNTLFMLHFVHDNHQLTRQLFQITYKTFVNIVFHEFCMMTFSQLRFLSVLSTKKNHIQNIQKSLSFFFLFIDYITLINNLYLLLWLPCLLAEITPDNHKCSVFLLVSFYWEFQFLIRKMRATYKHYMLSLNRVFKSQ